MAHREESGASFPEDRILQLSSQRIEAASRLQSSVAEIPHAWLAMEADVTGLAACQAELAESFQEAEGAPLPVEPFVMKSIVHALKQFPLLNSSWSSGRIVRHLPVHLSVPARLGDSLTTLVVRHAERLSIAGLAIRFHYLTERAKRGDLAPEESQGGTFTCMYARDSQLTKGIIAHPQAAYLSFERITRKLVVIEDKIAIRSMMHLCLSFDHRILDGRICGRFLQRVKHNLEKYDADTVVY
ncbi:2-oxo acid dehydrogenase subunit E2 [Paenibacillus sp. GCM10023248]|uniref:2-oxo acid dehydrogenase subunit E2 n=1 Tax=Bacillales TaxID=1385 RepID=UPI002378F607|nr:MULTISPECIES: 2-oxo acid dehydrogenase subunit E2 [Bacillales]MDD9270422.1 2-oxo acid dehydrogenase subunit E2 [Paenibacillus sp. MAHUQ-63]MDR6884216.1 2-oxoisovalerate dehydrogenase E2 component (dihydrolipoyl transacylase) [Bacillus sp. 3255]